MKGVGEEVVSQGVVPVPMGMERDCRRMRMYMYPAMGPSNNINLLDLGPGRLLDPSNLNNKYRCHKGSWGGGCFSGCCSSAYGYGKRHQAHGNVYMDWQWVPATINLSDLGPARPLDRSNLNNKYRCHEGS